VWLATPAARNGRRRACLPVGLDHLPAGQVNGHRLPGCIGRSVGVPAAAPHPRGKQFAQRLNSSKVFWCFGSSEGAIRGATCGPPAQNAREKQGQPKPQCDRRGAPRPPRQGGGWRRARRIDIRQHNKAHPGGWPKSGEQCTTLQMAGMIPRHALRVGVRKSVTNAARPRPASTGESARQTGRLHCKRANRLRPAGAGTRPGPRRHGATHCR